MEIQFNREIYLSSDDIKNILIKFYHSNYNFSGIFDIDFILSKNEDKYILNGANIKISENAKEKS